MQVSACTCVPLIDGASSFISSPSWETSLKTRAVSRALCGRTAPWNFSVPKRGWRQRKKTIAVAPRDTNWYVNIRSTPGRTSELTSCQVTLPALCSIRSETRLAPAEEDNRRRPPRHQLVREHPQHPWPHE